MTIVLARNSPTEVVASTVGPLGELLGEARVLPFAQLAAFVAEREGRPEAERWVWSDSSRWYGDLLSAGVRVRRCHDLRLSHAILRNSTLTAHTAFARSEPTDWSLPAEPLSAHVVPAHSTLFDLGETMASGRGAANEDSVAEYRRQLMALSEVPDAGRLRLLLAAESVGALIAAEMRHAGLPWRTDVHDAILTEELGPRVPYGTRPARLEELAGRIRDILGDQSVNPDSPQNVLKALNRAGLMITSTNRWELAEQSHPVIAPLLEYKKRARLLTANGWTWMDQWIVNERLHPDYVPGGAATGRWATSGGGALQLPRQVRAAVTADPGWKLVVADAAQLEPRILAALSADTAMAAAGRGTDMYAGIVASGVVESRDHAKVAMLGAMYGATTGESGRLMPKLTRAYPRAIRLVEQAARAGERGELVTTWLGRSSPAPGEEWREAQRRASQPGANAAEESRARSRAREWGRFTRNFVVQGSAAEWALCWMGEIRNSLHAIQQRSSTPPARRAAASGAVFESIPHLVFFLHDEIIVHTPEEHADEVAAAVTEAAAFAGRLLFGDFPVDFPLGIAVVDRYADAK
ncbi:bifunctional 3'-5' exonuclease/DNA polymerase [Microterricola viridarii]|uniref:DNA-directed DNA polymerase n=1 Tax=Microterricola viridarii TaxID=412690 RepID=A0A0X8E1G2_9MICO|nr:bifunctional 3'-5' exonuclease/DNA polymerase [Microterricola viridarii]AMB58591.1 3'-5' exonuclease [Microterricola viridarii]